MKSNPNALPTRVTLLLCSTLTVMAGATIAPSLPMMQEHFSTVDQVQFWVRLVLTIPALFIVIGSPVAGLITDRLGRKPLLIVSVVLYGLAGSSGFLLDSLPAILASRAILGLAVAGVMVGATTLIADYYVGAARATFMGLQAAFMGLGGVLFLTGGGFLADINWRLPFLIYLFAWLLLPLMLFTLFEPQRHHFRLSNAVIEDNSASNSAVSTRLLILIYGTALLTQIVFYLIPVQLPFYLKAIASSGAKESGLAIALTTLFGAFSSIAYGKVKACMSFVSILILTFGLMGVGYYVIGVANTYTAVLAGLAIAGLGLGLLMPNLTVWVSSVAPDTIRGRVLGGLTTFFFLGQFLSPLFSQPLSQQLGLATTYTLAGGILVALAIVLTMLRQRIVVSLASPRNTLKCD